jgi:hypothetical protein
MTICATTRALGDAKHHDPSNQQQHRKRSAAVISVFMLGVAGHVFYYLFLLRLLHVRFSLVVDETSLLWAPMMMNTASPVQEYLPNYYPSSSNDTDTTLMIEKYNPRWLVVSPTTKVALTFVPKVMCTTIKFEMNKIEDKYNPELCDFNASKPYAVTVPPRCSEARINPKIKTKLLLEETYTMSQSYLNNQ